MDYAGMAQRLGQFRQAQVPGGGQRPMNGWGHPGMGQGIMQGVGNKLQGAFGGMMQGIPQGMQMQRPQGMQPNGMAGWFGGGNVRPQMGQGNPMQAMRQFKGGMGSGGSM